jgi:hypothetical protein
MFLKILTKQITTLDADFSDSIKNIDVKSKTNKVSPRPTETYFLRKVIRTI